MAEKLALIVDDSRVARMTLSRLLQSNGFEIVEQDSAEEALKWLSGDIRLPDIIFMDVMMSGMDGVSATRELKLRPLLKNIPVVVCTGHESDADVEKARASGAAAVLSKPPSLSELSDVLARIETAQTAPAQPVSGSQYDLSLVNRIQARLEQHWLPDVLAKFQMTLDAGSQQFSEQKLQQIHNSLLPDLQQVIAEQMQGHFRQALELQQNYLQQTAQQSLETALAQFNMQDRLAEFETLKLDSQAWFEQQQQQFEAQFYRRVESELSNRIELILEQQLRPKLLAMINAQLTEENAALYELRDLQVQQAHQVSRIQWLAIGSFVTAALALLLVFYAD